MTQGHAHLRRRLLPSEERSDGDDDGQDPDGQHGEQRAPLRHDDRILQRVAHTDVAVDGDHAQRHDGRRAAQDVHRRPNVAEDASEDPVVQNLWRKIWEWASPGQSEYLGHKDAVSFIQL